MSWVQWGAAQTPGQPWIIPTYEPAPEQPFTGRRDTRARDRRTYDESLIGQRAKPYGGTQDFMQTDLLNKANTMDVVQKGARGLGLFGPVGTAASFGIGQAARGLANVAYPHQAPITMGEDLATSDFTGGSPLDIQRERHEKSAGAAKANAAAAGRSLRRAQQVDVAMSSALGHTPTGGRKKARARGLGGGVSSKTGRMIGRGR